MHTARRTFVATGTVALLAAAGVTAAIAADPAPPPPPRIAFVANGIVPADALAAGPIAGQLGAPIYTTQPDTLSPAAATGLDDYDPELVIVLGGPVAIHDTVIDQVEDATGLTESGDATPAGGIVRAAGGDRFDTAAAVADLLAAYNPAYLPINMQAIDADTVDGKHASDFLASDGKADTAGHADTAGDADTLDGFQATELIRTDFAQSGGTHTVSSSTDEVLGSVTMEITAPTTCALTMQADMDWDGNGTSALLFYSFYVDGAQASSDFATHEYNSLNVTSSITHTEVVDAGVHTIELKGHMGTGEAGIEDIGATATCIPFDGDGGTPAAAATAAGTATTSSTGDPSAVE